VQFIFEKFSTREMNYLQLAKYANDHNIRTHKGNMFENRTVEYILRNPVYIGKLRWTPTGRMRRNFNNPDTIVADGQHEPIVSVELWEEAQKTVGIIKELYPRKQHAKTVIRNWSYGLIKCGNCGKSLVINNVEYYQCNGYTKGLCKVSHSIRISRVESLILEQLKKDFTGRLDINIVPKVSDTDNTSEYELLTERLEKCTLKERRIREAYQDGIDTLDEYKANKKAVEQEKEMLLSQLDTLKNGLKDSGETEADIYTKIQDTYSLLTDESLPVDIKYQAAHFLIDKVVYAKAEQTLYLTYK